MDAEDLRLLRAEYAKVNHSDPQAMRDWFNKRPYLKSTDHAIIIKCKPAHIQTLKRRAGIPKKSKSVPPPPKPIPAIISGTPIPDWRENPAWVQQQMTIYSIKSLARWLSVPFSTFRDYIKRHNLIRTPPSEFTKSKNKYCNKEWCYDHYVKQHMSSIQCAKLAGVGFKTFIDWLVHFEIPVRTENETIGRYQPALWKRRLVHQLRQSEVVVGVKNQRSGLVVTYTDKITERFCYHKAHALSICGNKVSGRFHVTKKNSMIRSVPKVRRIYESDLGDTTYDTQLIIDRKEFNRASMVEQRLAIHDMIAKIRHFAKSGRLWTLPHPQKVLDEDLAYMNGVDLTRFVKNGIFTFYPRDMDKIPGRSIIEHYFGPGDFSNILCQSHSIMSLMKLVVKKPRLPITTGNIIRAIAKEGCRYKRFKAFGRFKYQTASTYASLFRTLRVQGSVYDMIPGMGSRAMACASLGLMYYTIPDLKFQVAAQNGFTDFIGLKWKIYDNYDIDVLIYDNQHNEPDMESVMQHAKHAKRIIVVCPHAYYAKVAQYKPVRVYRIKTILFHNDYDYVCVW